MDLSEKRTIREEIYQLLKSNKNIFFEYITDNSAFDLIRTDEEEEYNNPEIIAYFKVAPQETIYDIDGLNRFISNLLPELNPSHTIKAEMKTHPRKIVKVLDDKKTLKTGLLVFKKTYTLKEGNTEILDIDLSCIVNIFPDKDLIKHTFLYPYKLKEPVEVPWSFKP